MKTAHANWLLASAAVLLAGCQVDPQGPRGAPPSATVAELALAPVSAPLQLPPAGREVQLSWLVAELGRLSGQEVLAPSELHLDQVSVPLADHSPVPAGEVYTYVEGLLAQQGLVLWVITGGTRPQLGVWGRATASSDLMPLIVPPDQVGVLQSHPALYVQVTVPLRNVDARQLQTQLRALMGNSLISRMAPLGERSLMIRDTGRQVYGVLQAIAAADQGSAAPAPGTLPGAR